MSYSVRIANYESSQMLNICDAELVGKKIEQDDLEINISKGYYGQRLVEENEASKLLQSASIINMVGEKTISLSIKLGVGSKNGVKRICDVPFLIVFKM